MVSDTQSRRRKGYRFPGLTAIALSLIALLGASAFATGARGAELVMFVEAGCPWCARWDREVGEAYPRSEEGRIAPLRRVDIAAARWSGVRLAQPVTVTPTFVLVEDGAEVGRITGHPGADFFWGMLEQLFARLPAQRLSPDRAVAPGRQTGLPFIAHCGGGGCRAKG